MEGHARCSNVIHYSLPVYRREIAHLLETCVKQVMLYYCCISLVLPYRMVFTAMLVSVLLGLMVADVKLTSMNAVQTRARMEGIAL